MLAGGSRRALRAAGRTGGTGSPCLAFTSPGTPRPAALSAGPARAADPSQQGPASQRLPLAAEHGAPVLIGGLAMAAAWGRSRTRALNRPRGVRTVFVEAKGKKGGAVLEEVAGNFVEDIVVGDNTSGKYSGRVHTRFPPEPNGYLHIGHAKSICLNFGIARKFGGKCNLRFDDTNPASEEQEYIDSIKEDVRWLGFEWDGEAHYASDYFDQLHDWAVAFIEKGWAYVDELSAEEISEYRGSLTSPGKDSPYRDRPVEENLELFAKMRNGEVDAGKAVLRAKIDMAHRNVIMRDPIMYRIIKDKPHPRTGDAWCMYPAYDWAHGLSDALENITHSVCTLEFNMHNELYDWFNDQVKQLGTLDCEVLPKQHEFARLEMTNIVVSKRKLKRLVENNLVEGWDDPRMPTLSGMRRRGYPAAALRKLCELIGVTKVPTSVIQFDLLEACVREACQEEFKAKLLCVLKPLRVVVTNYPKDGEVIELPPEDGLPARKLPFGPELLIDQEDFQEEPEAGFKRLAPGRTAKLRYAYTITCDEVVKDEDGQVTELRCTYDVESIGQRPPKGAAVVHWAHATESEPVTVRLYDRLFSDARPEEREDFLEALNPKSLELLEGARCEPCVTELCAQDGPWGAQFERCGYFAFDRAASEGGPPVFNRTVTLREAAAKKAPQQRGAGKKKQKKQKKQKKETAAAS